MPIFSEIVPANHKLSLQRPSARSPLRRKMKVELKIGSTAPPEESVMILGGKKIYGYQGILETLVFSYS